MKTTTKTIGENGSFPNNEVLCLILYQAAISPDETKAGKDCRAENLAGRFEALFSGNSWPAAWRDGIYTYHHYHSTAHEALGVYSGRVRIQFGGDGGPVVEAGPGDVALIPAGVAHKLVSSEGQPGIVGAYPAGQSPDMQYGREGERPGSDRRIAAVPLPKRDPVLGESGPVIEYWGL